MRRVCRGIKATIRREDSRGSCRAKGEGEKTACRKNMHDETGIHKKREHKLSVVSMFIILILCYLVYYPASPALANQEASQDVDVYAYTSDMRVFIGGYGYYGAITINGEYYIPLSLFGEQGYALYPGFSWFMTEEGYQIVYDASAFPSKQQRRQIAYQYRTKPGIQIGKAVLSEKKLIVKTIVTDERSDFSERQDAIENGIYLLGETEPYVKASAFASITNIAIYENKNVMYLFYEKGKKVKRIYEEDLLGLLLTQLDDGNEDRQYWIEKISTCLEKLQDQKSDTLSGMPDMHDTLFYVSYNHIIAAMEWSEEAYASIFQAMCVRLGIPCDIIEGMRGEEWHTWNRVLIEDQWLYIDGEDFLLPAGVFAENHWWPNEDCPNELEEGCD